MADLVRLAYYPFLPEVSQAIQELGPSVANLLEAPRFEGARRRGLARVEGALDDKVIPSTAVHDESGAMHELLSVPIARMLCLLIGDRALMRRYAEAEGSRVGKFLHDDPESLRSIAAALEVPVREDDDGWQLHFSQYLRVAPTHSPDWKLINQHVHGGYLHLSDQRLAQLCGEALAKRIEAELQNEAKHPPPADLRAALGRYVDELKPKLEKARENWNTGDFGPVQDHLFPPCINDLFQQMKDGVLLPHHGRFAMASFLATIGMTVQDIVDYFSKIPNFDPDKSMYQITHIAGEQAVEKYTPPGCGWMQTNGVCPLDKRDGLCAKIKHPLSYYRAKIRFQKEDQNKAKAALAKGAA